MHLCGLFAGIFLLYIFSSLAQVNQPSCSSTEGDILNPDRITGKQYDLVHKDDTKLCPKSVSRCEQCRVAFNTSDKVGVRERTDKSGKIDTYTGNINLNYLTNCLKEYYQNSAFNAINVPSRTMNFLPKGSRETLAVAKNNYQNCIVVQVVVVYCCLFFTELLLCKMYRCKL